MEDLKFLEKGKLLSQGACIIADNILYPGVPEYRDYVLKKNDSYETKEYDTKVLKHHDIVLVSYYYPKIDMDVSHYPDRV